MRARQYVEQGWIPVARPDGRIDVVAHTVPGPDEVADIALQAGLAEDEVRVRTVPRDRLDATIARECRDELIEWIGESLARLQPERSAKPGLTRSQRAVVAAAVVLVASGLVLDWRLTLVVLFAAVSVLLSGVMSLRVGCVLLGLWKRSRRARARRGLPSPPAVPDAELPSYTILVPVFNEANIVARLIDNLSHLHYPTDRLEVLVLLEEQDLATISAARAASPPEHMRIVVVPSGSPQTKPRACNYGLVFARGDYLVIYDAEDRPELDQLRRVVADFAAAAEDRSRSGSRRPPLAVVQCALSYFNAPYNVLTRLFAIEYSFLFDAMLPGVDGTGLPIPLGGTSNHFDTELLRRIGGWDPYNVTEDADLGLRAAALGYRVGVSTSTTWEEACSQHVAFVRQRTRWIKGYLITSAVNLRHPIAFTRATGLRGLVCLLGLVLGTPLAFLIYPVMVLSTLVTVTLGATVDLGVPRWLIELGLTATAVSTLGTVLVSVVVAWPRYGWRIAGFAVFNPVYWLLHATAAWRAGWQTLTNPHQWEKTPHGLSDDLAEDEQLGSVVARAPRVRLR